MAQDLAALRSQLRKDLVHRLRPMTGRDPKERGRPSSPLELLYDLTYTIAFATAAEQLSHQITEGRVAPAIGAYVFAIFAISWAWLNFTWFASAYDNDDAVFRIAIICDNFSPHLSTRKDRRVGPWAAANNIEIAYTPTNSSWLNRIEAQFTALRYFTLDGTDHASHKEQASMIRRYIIWRNGHAYDERLRRIVAKANVA
jgi:hypothetical protein